MTCPRLIEVALPIREISAESVRDKNIHHAHISHLHVWWARRPLAASRAVVFASLVPDPDDPNCPKEFRQAVQRLLKDNIPSVLRAYVEGKEWVNDRDPYRPYEGISDTLRNRLLTFIAKWSPSQLAFEKGTREEEAAPSKLLDDRSLVKWETSDPDNHQGREVLRIARELVAPATGGRIPTLLDPFSGGGAIPLEASRLGCRAIANDYNPVSHIVLRATCEFPQTHGKNLVKDFEQWAERILSQVESQLSHLYPKGSDNRQVLAYLWARTVPCGNSTCRGEIPLLRSLLLRNKSGGKVGLEMKVNKAKKHIDFEIVKGRDVRQTDGTKLQRGPAVCPFCEQHTSEEDIRAAAVDGRMKERMVAVVVEGRSGKEYRAVEEVDLAAFKTALQIPVQLPGEYIVPEINSPKASRDAGSHRSINLELYGFTKWGQLFNHRQLVVMQNFIEALHKAVSQLRSEKMDVDYLKALAINLALWIDRIAVFGNSMCRWAAGSEIVKTPFGGQSVPMMWDFPETNTFADSSGTASTQLEYMVNVLQREAATGTGKVSPTIMLGSATTLSLDPKCCDYVVTDPPYGNSIAYADLSDFFYVWLKRSLGDLLPEVFITPQTPKEQEATSHKHRHHGSQDKANRHYRKLLTESFSECLRVLKEPKLMSVMFAHQTTQAWTDLISALFDAGFCPVATWPIATEMQSTVLALGTASLETSVTVVCRPRIVGSSATFKEVRKEIEKAVEQNVHRFWDYGIRGADLIVACYGPAVGVFGKYERVEKADGTPVDVPTLLEFAKGSALKAIAGEFTGDVQSRLYYVWSNLYGTTEQAWDDARLVVQVGGNSEDAMEMARQRGLFVVHGSTCRLALLKDRTDKKHLGEEANAPLIDQLHHALRLWKAENRDGLVDYLAEHELTDHAPLWKLAQALFEVLPRDIEDWRLISALLGERETLRTQAKRARLL